MVGGVFEKDSLEKRTLFALWFNKQITLTGKLLQKQQNSLIAGLRATNETVPVPETTEETKAGTPDREIEAEVKVCPLINQFIVIYSMRLGDGSCCG